MGDRANVAVLQGYDKSEPRNEKVYLYTHWSGEELPETVRKALDSAVGRGRWGDGAYLARIVFDAMVGDDQGAETGFGIATSAPDNTIGRPIIVLDPPSEMVYTMSDDEVLGDSISFADYCLFPRSWENLTTLEVPSKT